MGNSPETAAECVTLAADPKKMLALGLLLAALNAGEVDQQDILKLLALHDAPSAGVAESSPDTDAPALLRRMYEPANWVCRLNGTSHPQGLEELRDAVADLRSVLPDVRAALRAFETRESV